MESDVISLKSPIDVMYLIHKALRAEAERAEKAVLDLEAGSSLQSFNLAFNSWATSLVFHAEQEDIFITDPLTKRMPSNGSTNDAATLAEKVKAAMLAQEDEQHKELMGAIEDVFAILHEDIGTTSVITRTKQHLLGQVVSMRIVQEDHLDTEESLVLPLLRELFSEKQQLKAAKELLVDELADNPRWVIAWVSEAISPDEQEWLAGIESRFPQLVA